MSAASRASARPIASGTEGVISWKEMREVKPRSGRLARVASCWATRTSLARVEMPMPTQIDQSCEERGEEDLREQLRRVEDDGADDVGGAEADADPDDEVDRVGDRD